MPFITQGKTNLKYILIVAVLAAIVGGGILGYQYWWVPKNETKMAEVKMPETKPQGITDEVEVVFDVYYTDSGSSLENVRISIAVPKIINSNNERKEKDFNDYALKQTIENPSEYSKIKENLSLQEATEPTNSLFDSDHPFYVLYPISYLSKNEIVSILFRMAGTGGVHPFSSLFAINYDLKNNRAIYWNEIINISQDNFKSFILEKKPDSKFCQEMELYITYFYFTDKEFVVIVSGHRLNADCPESTTFSFSFEELKGIAKEDGIIPRLIQ